MEFKRLGKYITDANDATMASKELEAHLLYEILISLRSMKSLIRIISTTAFLILTFTLVGCLAPAPEESSAENPSLILSPVDDEQTSKEAVTYDAQVIRVKTEDFTVRFYRFIDEEAGVVCYFYSTNSLTCLPVKETSFRFID